MFAVLLRTKRCKAAAASRETGASRLLRCAAFLACMYGSFADSYGAAGEAPKPSSPAVVEIHDRWSAKDVVRDLEHIKRDVAKIIQLQSTGEMSTEELYFYYFRMHDFDDNNLLDGHEIKAAMLHSVAHQHGGQNHTVPEESIISYVDTALKSDVNQDGYISYPEIRAAL